MRFGKVLISMGVKGERSLYGATAFMLLNLYIFCLHTNSYKAGITQERAQKQEKSPINKEFNAIMEVRKLSGVVFACKSLGKDEKGKSLFHPHFQSIIFTSSLHC